MAATNKTPILLYGSTTATNTPSAGNLTNSSDGCEIAINVADGYLYYKDTANVVQKIGYKLVPTTNGGTGLTSFTSNGVMYASSTSALATSSNLTFDGTNLTSANAVFTPKIGTATSSALTFVINNSAVGAVDTSGNWFVGETSGTGSGKLNVNGRIVSEVAGSDSFAGTYYFNGTGGASNIQMGASGGIAFWTYNSGWGERARVFTSGGVSIGNTTDPGATNLSVTGSITSNGSLNASLGNVGTGPFSLTGNSESMVYSGSSNAGYTQGMSSLATVFFMAKNTAQGRSINAAGTLNANGADYAEYMVKNGDFKIAKGDICGVDANGKLTIVYDEAVTFVVKSTDPSFVGGDSWGSEETVGKRPEDTESQEYKDWEANLETVRQTVDRVAFAGRVPVNVSNAVSGDYIVPVKNQDGSIDGIAIAETDLTLSQYIKSVGQVVSVEDSVVTIIVKVA